MAGKGLKVVFPFTSIIDASQILSTMKQMRDIVGKEKVQIKLDVQSKMGEDLVGKLGGTQSFVNMVSQSATSIGKLTENVRVFKNASGDTFSVATSQIKEFRGENGELVREVIQLKTAQEAAAEALAGGYSTLVSTATVQSNFAKAVKLTEQNLNQAKTAMDRGTQSVTQFMEKSKNMGGAQVEAAKKAGQAFLDLASKMDWTEKDVVKLQAQFNALTNSYENFLKLKPQTEAGANVFQNFTTRITNAIKQTIAYSFSIGLVYKAQQLLNDAVRYAIDLNKEMVKIQVLQVEGARTAEDINKLAVAYNELAQAMGASTLEVAKGSVEWLRQGRTIDETQKLLKSTLYLSKLGAMEAADATNYLTAITNAFKVNAEDAVTVVDKLIAVDNIAATSAGELATAMRYTSESAQLAGVSMEQLISYIGTVSTVTRQNSEMIGQAFKTMFARMTLIEGGGKDEEGWTISKVEKALKAAGIAVKDVDGTFRNMGDVLEETAAKWDVLTERERISIAVAIAGVRQKEAFLVLMDNMDKALTYQAAQTQSAGLAQDRYGIYLESVEAKQAKLNAQMQEMYQKILTSDTIKMLLDLANALLELTNDIGGLIPVLTVLVSIFAVIKSQTLIASLASSFANLSKTMNQFSSVSILAGKAATALAGSIGTLSSVLSIASGVIGLIGVAIMAYNAIQSAQKEKIEEATQAVQKYTDTLRGLQARSGELSSTIDSTIVLLEKQEKGMRLSVEEAEKLNSSLLDLYNTLPTLDWTFVDGTPQLESTRLKAVELKEELLKVAMLQSGVSSGDFSTALKEENKAYEAQGDAAASAAAQIKVWEQAQNALLAGGDTWKKFLDDVRIGATIWVKDPVMKQAGKDFLANLLSSASDAKTIDDMQLIIQSGLINAWTSATENEGLQRSAREKWIMMIQSAIGSEDETSIMFMSFVDAEIAAGNKLLEEAKRVAQGVDSGERELIRTRQERYEMGKKVAISETESNDIFMQQSKWIIKLTDAFEKYYSTIKKGNPTLSDYITNAESILSLVIELNQEGANLEELDLSSLIKGGEFDTSGFEDYKNLLIEGIEKTLELNEVTETVRFGLQSLLWELKNAGQEAVNTVTFAGESFDLSSDKFSEYTSWLAQSLWNLYGEGQGAIIMSTNDGQQVVVNSAENIEVLLETMYAQFTNNITAMTSTAAANAVNLAGIISEILGGLSSEAPYFTPPVIESVGGGGGGGGGGKKENPRIKEIEKEVEALEDQKKALEDQIDAYKEWIKAQKESLKRQKEEADFTEELTKKHKNLGRIKAELALLALDDSEEAQKRRLELEEKAGELEEDISKDTEDRKYDLKIQALDDMQEIFEKNIREQIEGIEKAIEKLNDEKETIQDLANSIGGGGGGGAPSIKIAWDFSKESANKYGEEVYDTLGEAKSEMKQHRDDLLDAGYSIMDNVTKWDEVGLSIDEVIRKAEAYRLKLEQISIMEMRHKKAEDEPQGSIHTGGLVGEKHHYGSFAGNLMSNEVFAKLLKGEYVATEGQMNNFMKNVLPRIAMNMSPQLKQIDNRIEKGDINLDIDILVQGSLDEKVVPKIKNGILKEINKSLEIRGAKRTANVFG